MLFDRLNDLGDHVKLVELGHDVDAPCPRPDLVNQFKRDLHSNFNPVIACFFDSLPRFIRDKDSRHFIVQEVCMSYIDQGQNSNENRFF